jgi:hypothetical protein
MDILKKQKTLTLDVWGGLGDNLQVSTIPRRFYEKFGYKGVYISNSVPWRNKEIKELVWDLNPYIAGFTDKKGVNIADAGLIQYDGTTHWIANMEKIYQFTAPFSKTPEIYYDMSSKDNFNVCNKIIVDLTASNENNTMDKTNYRKNMKKYFDQLQDKITIVRLNNIKTDKTFIDYTDEIISSKNYEFIDINNIYEYCQIIKNCKKYICSFSGNHCLAAAIRKDFTCFAPNIYYNMKYFIFESQITYALI